MRTKLVTIGIVTIGFAPIYCVGEPDQSGLPAPNAQTPSKFLPSFVTLTEAVQTKYGTFGRGRQMRLIGCEGNYARVAFLDHDVLIPISDTDYLPAGNSVDHPKTDDAEVQKEFESQTREALDTKAKLAAEEQKKSAAEEQKKSAAMQRWLKEQEAKKAHDRAIKENRAAAGMTAEQVKEALGTPTSIRQEVTATEQIEEWDYYSHCNPDPNCTPRRLHSITFENGVVTSVVNTK